MSSTLQKVILSLLILSATQAWAIDEDRAAKQDFIIRQQNLLDRYEDYYTRMVLIDRENAERERGTEEMRTERKKLKAEYEKIRREYKRPKTEADARAELEWQREEKDRKKELDRTRAEYVRQKQMLEKMESGASRIPENEELGITMGNETL